MSKLRRMCAIAIVTAVLAVSTFAGQLDSPGAPAPAPTPSQTTTSTSTSMTTVILTILSLIR